jgi:hypothetical protein
MRTSIPHRPGQRQAVADSPDGRRIASGSQDRTIDLWDVPLGRGSARRAAGAASPAQ